VTALILGLTACNSIKWPVVPWTNAPAILPTTTTTIPPTPTPTVPPAPARNLAGNYMPELCNPTRQWPAMNFQYWETLDNGAKGVAGMELPKSATWILLPGTMTNSSQGGGWFYLHGYDSRTITNAIRLKMVGRDGTFVYTINNPTKSVAGIKPTRE